MSGKEKSTDPGLSTAERKALRVQEAQEAIADHAEAQTAFHENLERLRKERLARETAAGPMLYPAPEIPDDTLIDNVRFSTRIRRALNHRGLEKRRPDSRGFGCHAVGPAGSWTGLDYLSS
jgi:hypothetical protein